MFFLKTKNVGLIIHPPQKYTVQIKHYNPLSNTERIKPSDIQKFYATKKPGTIAQLWFLISF